MVQQGGTYLHLMIHETGSRRNLCRCRSPTESEMLCCEASPVQTITWYVLSGMHLCEMEALNIKGVLPHVRLVKQLYRTAAALRDEEANRDERFWQDVGRQSVEQVRVRDVSVYRNCTVSVSFSLTWKTVTDQLPWKSDNDNPPPGPKGLEHLWARRDSFGERPPQHVWRCAQNEEKECLFSWRPSMVAGGRGTRLICAD